jgi:monomeric sarcosine oxidase
METFDVVVIGLGIMGSAAAYSLAKRGVRILGIDANPPHHVLGSSHGPTRATRETYFESPEYVPLAQRSTELWRQLEVESGVQLLDVKGGLYFAPKNHPLIAGVCRAGEQHNLSVEAIDPGEAMLRYPGFSVPEGWQVLREEGAGLLQAERCLDAFQDLARRHGAQMRFQTRAIDWRQEAGGVVVTLDGEKVSAGKVVLTLGPWTCDAISELDLPLKPRRVPVVYFDTLRPELYDPTDFSIYFWATPEGVFAGKPHFNHLGTMLVRHDAGDEASPENVERVVTDDDITELSSFAEKYIPGINGGIRSAHVCLYTMTPDDHFILDHHPGMPDVTIATGFSGHGFKFAPVIGEMVADLALAGHTNFPSGFLSVDRFFSGATATV